MKNDHIGVFCKVLSVVSLLLVLVACGGGDKTDKKPVDDDAGLQNGSNPNPDPNPTPTPMPTPSPSPAPTPVESNPVEVPDTTAPQFQVYPDSGSTLAPLSEIVVEFSEKMAVDSVHWLGDLAMDNVHASWQQGSDADVLILHPRSSWGGGTDRSLLLEGKDLAGNDLLPVELTFSVDARRISVRGGNSDDVAGYGGSAGSITINKNGGSGALAVNLVDQVNATADFVLPDYQFTGGDNPWSLTQSAVLTMPGTPPANGYYLKYGDNHVYHAVNGVESTVSGLHILPDVILTISGGAELVFASDVFIEGIVRGDSRPSGGRFGVVLSAANIVLGGQAVINVQGETDGASSGSVTLFALGILSGDVGVINQGHILANGANSTASNVDGGAAGWVYIESHANIYNVGRILANGGDALYGIGGDGNNLQFSAAMGSVYNNAQLTVRGGDGANGGGNAGSVIFNAGRSWAALASECTFGEIVNTGAIVGRGGDTLEGAAGTGGYFSLDSCGAMYQLGSSVITRGGDSIQGLSKAAGNVELRAYSLAGVDASLVMATDIISRGGDSLASEAGAGGAITINLESLDKGSLTLAGYSRILAGGGSGSTGRVGGMVTLSSDTSIRNEADVKVIGGSATMYGAPGGSISMSAGGSLTNSAELNARGGNADVSFAGSAGGDGGSITLQGVTVSQGLTEVSGGVGETVGNTGEVIVQ